MDNVRKTRAYLLFFLVFITIFFHYIGILAPVENFFRSFLFKLSGGTYSASITAEVPIENDFESYEDLYNEYSNLKKKYRDTLIDKTAYEILEKENIELRKQLNFQEKIDIKTKGAFVVGKSLDPLRKSIIIDIGEESEVKIGNAVIVGEGIMIGKVVRVNNDSSEVQLLTDRQSKVASTIMNLDRSIGLIEGGYGLSVQMNFIPQNELVKIGDTIITSGLEEKVPYGLIIGQIEAVEKETYQPFQRAIIEPVIDLDKIRTLSVILE